MSKNKEFEIKDKDQEDEESEGPLNCFYCENLIDDNDSQVRFCDSCEYIKAHPKCVPFESKYLFLCNACQDHSRSRSAEIFYKEFD